MPKKRHNIESKLLIVKYVLEEKHSLWEASEFFGVAYQTIRMWVKHYENIGIEGLSIKNKTYSGEFKINVVEYMRENNLSLVQTAIHFSIPDHTRVRVWNKIYDEKGAEYLLREHRGRRKMKASSKANKTTPKTSLSEKELLKKIQYLETENAYLKKLNALIQDKERLKKKIK
jgi:transposase